MPDFFQYLLLSHIGRTQNPEGAPEDVDFEAHELELTLGSGGDEPFENPEGSIADALVAYATLPDEQLETLPTYLHAWFLERATWPTAKPALSEHRFLNQIGRAYFYGGADLRYLVLTALLSNEREANAERRAIDGILDRILRDDAPSRRRAEEAALIDLLLDLHFCWPSGGEIVVATLLRIGRRLAEEERGAVIEALRQRVEALGIGDKAEDLRRVLDALEGRRER